MFLVLSDPKLELDSHSSFVQTRQIETAVNVAEPLQSLSLNKCTGLLSSVPVPTQKTHVPFPKQGGQLVIS